MSIQLSDQERQFLKRKSKQFPPVQWSVYKAHRLEVPVRLITIIFGISRRTVYYYVKKIENKLHKTPQTAFKK